MNRRDYLKGLSFGAVGAFGGASLFAQEQAKAAEVDVKINQKVKGGVTVLGKW